MTEQLRHLETCAEVVLRHIRVTGIRNWPWNKTKVYLRCFTCDGSGFKRSHDFLSGHTQIQPCEVCTGLGELLLSGPVIVVYEHCNCTPGCLKAIQITSRDERLRVG